MPEFPLPVGTARHQVWLYASPDDRPRLAALFELEQQIMAGGRPGLDHAVAHARLAWWQEECERLNAGLPRHPQAIALLHFTRRAAGAPPDLTSLVDAARADLANAVPENRADLTRRCRDWAHGLFRHLAPGAVQALPGATDLPAWLEATGRSVEELALIAQVGRDAARGRLRVPLDELDALGVDPRDLASAHFPGPLGAHLGARHRELRTDLAQRVLELDGALRPALR
ncbi:MAG: squalene/phytoene synthase family protein, partial [Steroidobacteraceae bacterium]